MTSILDEVCAYLERTGTTPRALSRAAGLNESYIANVQRGASPLGAAGAGRLRQAMSDNPDGIRSLRDPDIPADFAEHARTETNRQLAERYGKHVSTISGWIKLRNVVRVSVNKPARVSVWAAERLAELERLVDNGLSDRKIAEQLGVSRLSVRKKRQALGLKVPAKTQVTIPTNFRSNAHRPMPQLAMMYAVPVAQIRKWRADIGFRPPATQVFVASPAAAIPAIRDGIAARAAQHLRRFCSNVYDGTVRGKQFAGLYFVAGKGMIPTAKMIELAKKHGFDAAEWTRIAA